MTEKLTDADRAALLDSGTALGKRIVRIIDQLTAALAETEKERELQLQFEQDLAEMTERALAARKLVADILDERPVTDLTGL